MAAFNRVVLVGNLTRDPEVRYTPSGTAVSDIGLAVNRNWFDKQTNSRREEVTFVDITLWARTAEVAGEYLSKGSQVLVEGRLQQDSWEDRESGQRRSKLKVVCESLQMLGNRDERSSAPTPAAANAGAPQYSGGGDFSPEPTSAPNFNEAPPPMPQSSFDAAPVEAPDDEVPF